MMGLLLIFPVRRQLRPSRHHQSYSGYIIVSCCWFSQWRDSVDHLGIISLSLATLLSAAVDLPSGWDRSEHLGIISLSLATILSAAVDLPSGWDSSEHLGIISLSLATLSAAVDHAEFPEPVFLENAQLWVYYAHISKSDAKDLNQSVKVTHIFFFFLL